MKKISIIIAAILAIFLVIGCSQDVTVDSAAYADLATDNFTLNGKGYSSLQAAFDAAKAGKGGSSGNDNVIRLTKNLSGPGAVASGLTGYSIDFGSYTYTFTNVSSGSAGLTLSDGTDMVIKGAMKLENSSSNDIAVISVKNSKLAINGDSSISGGVEVKNAELTVNDSAKLAVTKLTVSNAEILMNTTGSTSIGSITASDDNIISIEGAGAFSINKNEGEPSYCVVNISNENSDVKIPNADGTSTEALVPGKEADYKDGGKSETENHYCAYIETKAYTLLSDAIKDGDGKTIKLVKDISVDEVAIASGQSITIDLNGKTVGTYGHEVIMDNKGSLFVFDSSSVPGTVYVNTLSIEIGDFTVEGGCYNIPSLYLWGCVNDITHNILYSSDTSLCMVVERGADAPEGYKGWNLTSNLLNNPPTDVPQDKNNAQVEKVETIGNTVVVSVPLSKLITYDSTNPGQKTQGPAQWIGLEIKTGLNSIDDVYYNGYPLTNDDKEEAEATGCSEGSFVLYIRADQVVTVPKEFALTKDGYPNTTFKVVVINTDKSEFNVRGGLLPQPTIQDQRDNNAKVESVETEEGVITVTVPLSSLKTYASTEPGQGSHKWIGLEIKTGFDSLEGMKYGSYSFTDADIAEAAATGCTEGSFVLYIKAEDVVNTPAQFTLSKDGKSEDVTIKVVDSTEFNVTARTLPHATLPKQETNNSKVSSVVASKSGDNYTITVSAPMSKLTAYASTDSYQASLGPAQWIGLEIKTGFDSLKGMKYGTYSFTDADIAEAAATGCSAGSFVLYIRADEVLKNDISFSLTRGDKEAEVTIEVVNTENTGFNVIGRTLPSPTIEQQTANNNKVESVETTERVITVRVPLDQLTAYESTDSGQPGASKWIGLEIKTGFDSLEGMKYGTYSFTDDDIAEAEATGCSVGSFVLYIRAEQVVSSDKTFTLTNGTDSVSVTVKVEDSGL